MVTATRPQGLGGRPFALFSSSSVQVAPPSVDHEKAAAAWRGGTFPARSGTSSPCAENPTSPRKGLWNPASSS